MTKNELSLAVAAHCGITKALAKETVDVMIAELAKGIASDERTYLPGLGIFSKSVRAARSGRNPKTGESVEIAPKTVIKFKSSIVVE